jgi:NAD(P)H-dependent FMN reductase
MNILILVGSADKNSHSLHLGRSIADSLAKHNSEVELIDLITYGLPPFNRQADRQNAYSQETKEFIEKSRQADAYVWVTPVYHNSFSSTLKNALDWQHFFLDGKTVGLASNGGNRAPVAIDQLMVIARSQHLVTSFQRVCTEEDDYDSELNIVSPAIQRRIDDFAAELVSLTNKIKVN